jgi:eukaryotic-like serine/threonine-protein kinase
MSSTILTNGAIFAGRYRVVRPLARGGMGVIYEVLHLETERRRALKVMLPGALGDHELRERFLREAKVGAPIDSDFVVEVFDAGIDEATDTPFLVMELLRGEDLGERLRRLGRIAPSDVVIYLHHTALALDQMHRASVVHRDVKPENLFLMEREDGPPRIKLLDFGVAKVVTESVTAGKGIGTPLYMAPEQYEPCATLTGAVDVYALGMVAYGLLVGSAYWADEALTQRLFALVAVTMRGPEQLASERAAAYGVTLPPAFDAWFTRTTALDPACRFATAGEAVRALAEALGVAPPSRPVPSSPFGWSTTEQDAQDGVRSLASSIEEARDSVASPPPSRTAPSAPARLAIAPSVRPVAPRRLLAGVLVALGAGVVALVGAGFSAVTGADRPAPAVALRLPPPASVALPALAGADGRAASVAGAKARSPREQPSPATSARSPRSP